MQAEIIKLIKTALTKLGSPDFDFVVERPDTREFGDYFTNAALIGGKLEGIAPRVFAEKLLEELKKHLPDTIDQIDIAGAGFINFHLTESFFEKEISSILKNKTNYGRNTSGQNQKVIVEYSSVNIAKPFGIGHLRSTIIGQAIANLFDFCGYDVIRDNHLGDWGTQFGKQIVALKKWGNEAELDASPTPVKLLVALYQKFTEEAEKDPSLEDEARAAFTLLEKHDPEIKRLWQKCVVLSLAEFNRVYDRLGIKFDTSLGESFVEDKLKDIVDELKKHKLLQESQGAHLVFLENFNLPPLMILKKDGSSLYATRDLAIDKWRKATYGEDIIIVNEVGVDQSLYFRQLYAVESMLGWFSPGQRVHVAHGYFRFHDGKMSTRKGNLIWLEEVLDEAVNRARLINETSAEEVGLGAIKFNDLKRNCAQDIIFNWEDILNLKGDSGPYLQYSIVRGRSILNKAAEVDLKPRADFTYPADHNLIEAKNLERLLPCFKDIILRSQKEFSPHFLATYLLELAGAFNNFYAHHQILKADEAHRQYLLNLTSATVLVLESGLNLLGISVPDSM